MDGRFGMDRAIWTTLIGIAALSAVPGCANPPMVGPAAARPYAPQMSASPGPMAAPATSLAPTAANVAGPDPRSVEGLLDQVSQSENLDPASRERLAADLRQTDPALWPAVVQSFRAAIAYRRQMDERRAGALAEASHPADAAAPASPPAPPSDRAPPPLRSPDSPPRTDRTPPPTAQAAPQVAVAAEPSARPSDDRVEPASYRSPRVAWQDCLAEAIAALEAELREPNATSDQADKHARLRMLSLVAGRRDDALRPIPGAPPSVQDFWRHELYGLGVWLDAERVSDASRRAGEAREQLAGALVPLGSLAPLVVRNLAFITQVQSYGDYKPFAKCEFLPDEEVLLYAEIENFTSEETPKGFHTSLEGSYRIFDARNQQVVERALGATEETCRSPRRDFFLVYYLRIPKRIYGGKHTLQLTVVDRKSKKVGQSSIEFTVKDAGT